MGEPGESLEVCLIQFVSLFRGGEKIPMGKREAQFVTLRQLREEVGNDACRFFYLMRSHDQPLDFDLELAKSRSNENPVYYIQYAHARVASVMKQLAAPRDSRFDLAQGLAQRDAARRRAGAGAAAGAVALPGRARAARRASARRTRWCITCANWPTPSTPSTTPSSSSCRRRRCAMRAWRWSAPRSR